MKVFLNNIQVFVTLWDPGPSVWRTRGVIVFLPSLFVFCMCEVNHVFGLY